MNPIAIAGPGPAETVVFYVLAVLVAMGAMFTITRRNPVTAVVSLVFTFFFLAAIYATLAAHFLAIVQVMVYAGAIMVLFIFVIMILNREEVTPVSLRGIVTRVLGIGGAVYLFWTFLVVTHGGPGMGPPRGEPSPEFGTVAAIGDLLFREFLFPFEAISLLLLVAIVGGVVVSRSAKQEEASEAAAARINAIRALGDPAEADHGDGHGKGAEHH